MLKRHNNNKQNNLQLMKECLPIESICSLQTQCLVISSPKQESSKCCIQMSDPNSPFTWEDFSQSLPFASESSLVLTREKEKEEEKTQKMETQKMEMMESVMTKEGGELRKTKQRQREQSQRQNNRLSPLMKTTKKTAHNDDDGFSATGYRGGWFGDVRNESAWIAQLADEVKSVYQPRYRDIVDPETWKEISEYLFGGDNKIPERGERYIYQYDCLMKQRGDDRPWSKDEGNMIRLLQKTCIELLKYKDHAAMRMALTTNIENCFICLQCLLDDKKQKS